MVVVCVHQFVRKMAFWYCSNLVHVCDEEVHGSHLSAHNFYTTTIITGETGCDWLILPRSVMSPVHSAYYTCIIKLLLGSAE